MFPDYFYDPEKKMKLSFCQLLAPIALYKPWYWGQASCRTSLPGNGTQKYEYNVTSETSVSIVPSFLSHLPIMIEAAIF